MIYHLNLRTDRKTNDDNAWIKPFLSDWIFLVLIIKRQENFKMNYKKIVQKVSTITT